MIRFHGTAFLASGIAFTNRLCGARKCIRTLARTPYRQLHHGIQPPCSFPAFTSYKPHSAQPRNISSCVTERETVPYTILKMCIGLLYSSVPILMKFKLWKYRFLSEAYPIWKL